MKTIKNLLLTCALFALALSTHAASPTIVPINLQTNTTVAGASATNLTSITIITSYTNITTLWSSSSSAFVNTTNITSVTNTSDLAVFSTAGQSTLPLEVASRATASSTANAAFDLQLSQDKTRWGGDQIITYAQTGTTEALLYTNPPTFGFPFARIAWFTNAHATVGITNLSVKGGQYPPITTVGALGR